MWSFVVVEHWNSECLGLHVWKEAMRFNALEPLAHALTAIYADTHRDVAHGLALRMDHTVSLNPITSGASCALEASPVATRSLANHRPSASPNISSARSRNKPSTVSPMERWRIYDRHFERLLKPTIGNGWSHARAITARCKFAMSLLY